MMTDGSVDGGSDCWSKGERFWWGCEVNLVEEQLARLRETNPDAVLTTPPVEEAARAANTPDDLVPFRPGKPLSTPLRLHDTHASSTTLCFSYYALAFQSVIDYIFASRNVEVVTTLLAPSGDELSADVALPSVMYPSDHIALVSDVVVVGHSPLSQVNP